MNYGDEFDEYGGYYEERDPNPKSYRPLVLACLISCGVSVFGFYELCLGVAWAYHAAIRWLS